MIPPAIRTTPSRHPRPTNSARSEYVFSGRIVILESARRGDVEAAADGGDVVAEDVELVGEGRRRAQLGDGAGDLVEARVHPLLLFGRLHVAHLALDRHQRAVPA